MLCQFLGGSIFLSIATNIFGSKLTTSLTHLLSAEATDAIIKAGAAGVRDIVKPETLEGVLSAYNDAITCTFVSSTLT